MTGHGTATRFAFSFDHDHGVPPQELIALLGSKGAGLAEMTSQLGMSVPHGFTISVDACRHFRTEGWPEGLREEVRAHMEELSAAMGRPFGDPDDPLLVSVRSGASVSMPGMMDTVLNLGINGDCLSGLGRALGDELFAWDTYRRFIEMYATIVMGVDLEDTGVHEPAADVPTARREVEELLAHVERIAGRPVPTDPWQQLEDAIEAVFRSWDTPRAKAYRAKERLDDEMGTAVNIQAMVFGNRGDNSGTGVVFTRNPSTGTDELYGDYLPRGQGEDVVAGTAHTIPIGDLETLHPKLYAKLNDELRRLEIHYRDMCDVEFTVEDGRLWILQTRVGKRSAVAAVKLAAAFTRDPDIRLTHAEACARVDHETRERARADIISAGNSLTARGGPTPMAFGLGASPGRATGRVVLSSADALNSDGDVILVRPQTNPADVPGMATAVGILTARGGLASHAAVIARAWGRPAVVGTKGMTVGDGQVTFLDGTTVSAGDEITIDGSSGAVWRGSVAVAADHGAVAQALPELALLEQWDAETG